MSQHLENQAHQAFDEKRFDDAYLLASRVLDADSENAIALSILIRVNLKHFDRLPEAIELTKRLCAMQPEHPLRRRIGLALIQSPMRDKGVAILESAVADDPTDSAAAGRLMEHYLDTFQLEKAQEYLDLIKASGDPAGKFIGSDHGDFQTLRVERLKEELAASDRTIEFPKIVAVCSVSYSGSTFFSELLGRLEGVYNIGESHTLSKGIEKDEHGRRIPVTEKNATVENMLPCSVCLPGNPCKTFSIDFRKDLIRSQVHWYKRILEYTGSQTLVSSDKNFNHYVELDPLQRFNAVVLFKNPVNSYFSQYKRSRKNKENGLKVFEPKEYLSTWKRSYEKFIYSLNPAGKHLFISWEMFTKNPYYHLKRICTYLNIPFDHDVLELEKERVCCFGGNFKVVKQFREKKVNVREERKVTELPPEIVNEIESDAGSARLHAELRRKYFEHF